MQAPPNEAAKFFAQVRGAKAFQNGYYSYPCNISFVAELEFAGVKYTIPEKCELSRPFEPKDVAELLSRQI